MSRISGSESGRSRISIASLTAPGKLYLNRIFEGMAEHEMVMLTTDAQLHYYPQIIVLAPGS